MGWGSSRGLRPPRNSLERWVVGMAGALIHGLAFKLVLHQLLWPLAPALGLIGLGAFVWSLRGASTGRGAALGFLGWAAAAAAGLYWVSTINWLAYGLMIAYFALLGAIFGAAAIFLRTGSGSRAWVLLVPALWTAMEYARSEILTGFPWMLTGSLFAGVPLATDVADLGGVYLVSFACALLVTLAVSRKPQWTWLRLVLMVLLAGAWLGYGAFRTYLAPPSGSLNIKVAVVQPAVPFKVGPKADPDAQIAEQKKLSALVAPGSVDLMVWSETMVPGDLMAQVEPLLAPVATEKKCYLLAGGVFRQKDAAGKSTGINFNSAVLVSPEGKVVGQYHKRHLVPFGEYVPLGGGLPYSDSIFHLIGTIFTPGAARQELPSVKTTPLGVSICFEDVFPQIARDDAKRGARVLVNLTNDSWFKRTSQARQHLALAALRAVETRRPLVRATNTGISALVGADGRITVPKGGRLWEKGLVRMNVKVPPLSTTSYMLAGDLFAWLCAAGAFIGLLAGIARKKLGRSPKIPPPAPGPREDFEEELLEEPAETPVGGEYMPPSPPPLELEGEGGQLDAPPVEQEPVAQQYQEEPPPETQPSVEEQLPAPAAEPPPPPPPPPPQEPREG